MTVARGRAGSVVESTKKKKNKNHQRTPQMTPLCYMAIIHRTRVPFACII